MIGQKLKEDWKKILWGIILSHAWGNCFVTVSILHKLFSWNSQFFLNFLIKKILASGFFAHILRLAKKTQFLKCRFFTEFLKTRCIVQRGSKILNILSLYRTRIVRIRTFDRSKTQRRLEKNFMGHNYVSRSGKLFCDCFNFA